MDIKEFKIEISLTEEYTLVAEGKVFIARQGLLRFHRVVVDEVYEKDTGDHLCPEDAQHFLETNAHELTHKLNAQVYPEDQPTLH